jgi:hypothetical protein
VQIHRKKKTDTHPIDPSLKTWSLNLIFELDFLSISDWIFAGYTGSKIKFEIDKKSSSKIELKNQFCELKISKIKCRSTGGQR